MNLLQHLERLLQRSVERPFTRLTGTRLQPIEVARVLEKELVANRRVSIDHVYAPNQYRAELAEEEFRQFEPFLGRLQGEIAGDLIGLAQRRGFALVGEVTVELLANPKLRRGDILASAEVRESDSPPVVASSAGAGPVARTALFAPVNPAAPARAPAPAIRLVIRDERGVEQRVIMQRPEMRIGRGLENDVVLEGLSVSRSHARLIQDGGLVVEDLGSRNGVFVNGERVQRRPVAPGDVIRLGAAEVRFLP